MKKTLYFFLYLIIGSTLISCSSSTKTSEKSYNPQTQAVDHQEFTPYFQLNTELIPQQLEITLVTHLNKYALPSSYTLKKMTRRLKPNDYMAENNAILYLKNLTQTPIQIEFYSINIEQKHFPLSARRLIIPASGYQTVRLGQVSVDLRLTSLLTRIEYFSLSHQEKTYDMQRISKDKVRKQEESQKETSQSSDSATKSNSAYQGTYINKWYQNSNIVFRENNPIESYFKERHSDIQK